MTESDEAIMVFTARSPERIIEEGGSQAWVLNAARAKQCKWLICTQNRHNPNHEFSDATQPHGSAFLLGRIAGIQSQYDSSGGRRWSIAISEFARIDCPGAWDHGRNPVRYTSLKETGIGLDGLEFEPIPSRAEVRPTKPLSTALPAVMTIAQAKAVLAATFGVKPDAIEITIRG
jgi:hypothetical protein